MKSWTASKSFLVYLLIALWIIFGLLNPGPAAAFEVSLSPVVSGRLSNPGNPCLPAQPAQNSTNQDITSRASRTICKLYSDTAFAARSLFSGNGVLPYIPWAPVLVGLVLACFLALAGFCAWKMKGYRPRRKYRIGRVI